MDLAEAPLLRGSERRFDAASFSCALILRLSFLWVFLAKGLDASYGRDLYYGLALSWLGWAPAPAFDASHPPLYTAAIAAVLGLFRSPNPLPVLLLQCALGAACAPLTRRLAGRLGVDGAAARLAALWVAFDPGLIFFTPHLGTETLFVAMELAFFIRLIDELGRPLSGRLAALGLWGGLAVLCRSMFGGYPAFLFLVLWRARGFVRALLFCAVLGLGWLAPTIGWGIRNYFKYGRVVPVAAQMGWNLYEGFTLDREEVRRRPIEMGIEADRLGLGGPIERGDYFAKKTASFMRENPLKAMKIIAGKAVLFWRPLPYDPHSWWQRWAFCAYFMILFSLALYGAATVAPNRSWQPVWALFAYLTALHSIFFTSLRYRLPLEPLLCLLAAVGAVELMKR
ncbi:MAG: glycosyltransferase family 39 protein, partial [Elusimicrobia bacterium]|nr:glycosyltransferase family 39 protein [Elusimicrobiota bacterium]